MSRQTLPVEIPAPSGSLPSSRLSNAEIAAQLLSLAQLLSTQGENPFKLRAYRRAAEVIKTLPESVDEWVRNDADLTQISGIGKGIAGALREIVLSGSLRHLETLRSTVSPELAALSEHPRLDPKRVMRIYKKLKISTVAELKAKLEDGAIAEQLGARMDQHVRQALVESREMLLFDADEIVPGLQRFLEAKCGATRVEVAGDFRRRVEVVRDLAFVVEADDFASVVEKFTRYGGRTEKVSADEQRAAFRLSSGLLITLERAHSSKWGLVLMACTGAPAHLEKLEEEGYRLEKLAAVREKYPTEEAVYRKLGLQYIAPELREGRDEVARASCRGLPVLVTVEAIRGDLHAHSTSSDGTHSIDDMAEAARARGYVYLGISDHSQSLKIAGGVSEEDLWRQIRYIDKLNTRLKGIRVLKSAEVDILADGSLDYPDELLKELDYTVCSIHSKFSLDRKKQTERILQAMDNPYFTFLGHATGRLLLKRSGYELDFDRLIVQAKAKGCYFEINSSPDRLDLSAEHARLVREAGIKIAICTDAHSTVELDFIRCGVDQARRAGLEPSSILNCHPLGELLRLLKRT